MNSSIEDSMAEKISASDLHLKVGQVIARIRYAGERFIIERRGEPVAAVVSIEDLRRLEQNQEEQLPSREERAAARRMAMLGRELMLARRNGMPLANSVDLIHKLREERDREVSGLH